MKKYKINKILPVTMAFFIFCLELQTVNLYAQPQREWTSFYPETNTFSSGAAAMAIDDSGNVYTTGHSEGYNGTIPWNSYTTVKYNTSGVMQWVTNFTGETGGGKFPHDIAVDNEGNVYVTGYAHRTASDFDFCTIKYNSSGVQQWVRYYDGPVNGIDRADKIAIDNNGNIYISGNSTVEGTLGRVITTIKYSNTGDVLWIKSFGSSIRPSYVNGMKADENCNIYITGENKGLATTLKYDSSGNLLWSDQVGFSAASRSLALDKENNVYITGYKNNYNPSLNDCLIIKYTPTGVPLWIKLYNPDSTNNGSDYMGNSIVSDTSGNCYVCGSCRSDQYSGLRQFIVKYDANGNKIWEVKNDSLNNQHNSYIDIDKYNQIYIASNFHIGHPVISKMKLIKYNNSGIFLWEQSYIDSLAETSCIKVDKDCNIYQTGHRKQKMLTMKYSQYLGVKPGEKYLKYNFILLQNYPNPFNSSTIIRFYIPTLINDNKYVRLEIYDISGRLVKSFYNKIFMKGFNEVIWNASNYSSGIYFYRVNINGFEETKKMILIK
ncbi:MAG: T9SS C-terminal target domain-containing protein [Ignavibacteriae bacterium]|nr:MAG: T9SS C-terminal target domain-containing protein [Ignavibacteriota bacterium]